MLNHTIHTRALDGGAHLLVVDVPGAAASKLSAHLQAGYQTLNQDKVFYEVPHVLEHVLMGSTQGYPDPNALGIAAERHGARSNAYTDEVRNRYWFEFAEPDTIGWMVGLLLEVLARPWIQPDVVDRELGNVREELTRNRTRWGRVASLARRDNAYLGRVVADDFRLDWLPNITPDSLRQHYQRAYTAANLRFLAAGEYGDEGVAVAEQLADIPRQLPRGQQFLPSEEPGRGFDYPTVLPREIESVYYDFGGYFGPTTAHERRALELLRILLGGSWESRIYGQARRAGLAYGIDCELDLELGYGELSINGYVSPANALPLFELIAAQLRAVAAGDVDEDELWAAKRYAIGNLGMRLQTPGQLHDWYQLQLETVEDVTDGAICHLDDYIKGLSAVTPDDIQAAARALMGARGLSLVGPVDMTLEGNARQLLLLKSA